jgi:hypothetical protein
VLWFFCQQELTEKGTNTMATYESFTYDLGSLKLTKAERSKLEKEYEGSAEYMVCSDETADAAARGEILSNLWAFNSDFLAGETGLPSECFKCLQEKMSEDCNEAVTALIKSTCGLDQVVESAIQADGRGHTLAAYDGEEIEYTTKSGKTVYLYRCN